MRAAACSLVQVVAGGCAGWGEVGGMEKPKENSWTSGDPAHKKLIAYGIVGVFVGVLAVMGVRSVSGPQLFAGDRLESVACRLCQGTGKEGDKRCRLCLGTTKVKVIVPGPAHPVEVRGTVRDAAAFPNAEAAQAVAEKEAGVISLKPVEGAVHLARLVFETGGKEIAIEGKATGRFRCVLPPANYHLRIEADGFQELKQDFPIAPLKQPVWPKRPGVSDKDDEKLQPVFLLTRK